jgi:glycosyltransferase involved in cell wall biosynthesis
MYALTSREDPFPSVVLEAMEAGLAVVGFDGTGGCATLISRAGGRIVGAGDIGAFANALVELARSPAARFKTLAARLKPSLHV